MSGFEEIHIQLPDGYSAYARYWAPDKLIGGVLYLHGIQSHCGWYEQSAERLRRAGLAVLQPDRRGSGRNREARGHADGPKQLIQDTRCCLEELARRTGHDSNHVLGVRWGGKLAVALHVTDSSGIASLALVTPGLFPIVDVSPMDKLRIGWSMVSDRYRFFDIPLNDPELFTSSPTWIEWLRRDELQLHQATAGFFLASRRMDRTAHRLAGARAVPLNVFLAEDERIIDNAATRAFVRDLPWPEVTLTTYAGVRHTLEFEAKCGAFFDDLVGWITTVNASRCRTPTG
jgi:alpha-beta hydrolase superfamily lysophospholipase